MSGAVTQQRLTKAMIHPGLQCKYVLFSTAVEFLLRAAVRCDHPYAKTRRRQHRTQNLGAFMRSEKYAVDLGQEYNIVDRRLPWRGSLVNRFLECQLL